jgi:hypothetical protein
LLDQPQVLLATAGRDSQHLFFGPAVERRQPVHLLEQAVLAYVQPCQQHRLQIDRQRGFDAAARAGAGDLKADQRVQRLHRLRQTLQVGGIQRRRLGAG